MRAMLASLALASVPAAAQADDLAVSGKLGFMGEWQVAATAREIAAGRRAEFSGPLTLTHVEACAPLAGLWKSQARSGFTAPASSGRALMRP